MTRGPRRAPLGAGASLTMSALGGLLLAASFPDLDWWWAAPIGVAAMLVPLIGRSGTGALAVGFVGGAAFYGALVAWTSLFLGPVPYLALAGLMSIFTALGALLIARAYDWLPRRWPGRTGRLLALPAAVGGLWTLRESVAGSVPYGGFAWGRVAQSQSSSPFGDLVGWLGLSGLSFVIVGLTALAVEAVRLRTEARARAVTGPTAPASGRIRVRADRADVLAGAARAVAVGSGVALLAAIPAFPVATIGSMRVAAVQGDTPEAGYFTPGARGDVLRGHLAATSTIAPGEPVDLILWPEGSVDVSPVYQPSAAAALDAVSETFGAPVVANTVTVEPGATEADDAYFNTQFVWMPGVGMTSTVSKLHPIPFGEYIPDRDVFFAIAPDLIGLVQRSYTPGEGPAVIQVAGVAAGVLICYDVVDDGVVRGAVASGAHVLLAPTNNADFGDTAELAQQLAFARLRAMETGRAVVQVSTVGDSAVYLPDGTELASIPRFEPGVMLVTVPLSDTITPAVAIGRGIEIFAGGLGVALLLGARLGGPANTGAPPRRSAEGARMGSRAAA